MTAETGISPTSIINLSRANVLLIDGPGAQLLPAVPNESWGLHLLDVNVAQGDLVDLVAAQTATYMR